MTPGRLRLIVRAELASALPLLSSASICSKRKQDQHNWSVVAKCPAAGTAIGKNLETNLEMHLEIPPQYPDSENKRSLRERQRRRSWETAPFTVPFSLLFIRQPASDEKM